MKNIEILVNKNRGIFRFGILRKRRTAVFFVRHPKFTSVEIEEKNGFFKVRMRGRTSSKVMNAIREKDVFRLFEDGVQDAVKKLDAIA